MTTTETALYACSWPGCDTFPWDTADELIAHMLTHATQAPAAAAPTPAERVARTFPGAEEVPELRSFSPGGTHARTAAPKPADGPSDKQWAFLRSLAADKGVTLDEAAITTKRAASAEIDRLKALRVERPAAPARKAAAPAVELKHGAVYVTGSGDYVKAVEGRNGFYGKAWDGSGWEYGRGLLAKIERALSADEAAAWGHEHHACVFCSRSLTDDRSGRSVQVGYGPVCADKFGLPWG